MGSLVQYSDTDRGGKQDKKDMGEIEELKDAFPDIEVRELQGGANLYFPNKLITVYFRRKKYAVNNQWSKYSYWQDFIPLVKQLIEPKPKVVHIEPQAVKTGNKVQDCIYHILKKRETIMRDQPDNKLAAFCLTLISELQQYL